MAITTTKVTYSLRPETTSKVEELAAKWGVPKSEVVQRAINSAAVAEGMHERRTPLEALEWLQKNGISPEVAKKWNAEVRRERRAWGRLRR